MKRLAKAYKNLAKMVEDIGKSYEGRTISALKVFSRSVQLKCSQRAFIPGVSHRTKLNKFFIELNRTKSEFNRTMKFDFSSVIERNRTTNFLVSSISEPNRTKSELSVRYSSIGT